MQLFLPTKSASLSGYPTLGSIALGDISYPTSSSPSLYLPHLRRIIVKAFLTALYVSVLVLLFTAEQVPASGHQVTQQLTVSGQSASN